MTKYWKTIVQKDGSDVNLYVGTSEECIRRDHAAASSGGSLILSARHLKGAARDDHDDLAAGAFHHFMGGKGFTQADPTIDGVDGIPPGLKESVFGGIEGNPAVTVFYEG